MSKLRAKGVGGFSGDESGSVTAFTAVIFIMLVVSAGMAIDFMRHEYHRAELQDAVDRGVLAAASAAQLVDTEVTVRGYLQTSNYIPETVNLSVNESNISGGRVVRAEVDYEISTFFLRLIGMPTLDVYAGGAATESFQNFEVALALDVSTSMSSCTSSDADLGIPSTCDHWSGTPTTSRLETMKVAAQRFIDRILVEGNPESAAVSLVPFAGQVNPGQTAFNRYAHTTVHPYSYCLEFDTADYDTIAPPAPNSLDQMQFFSLSSYYNLPDLDPTVERGWCPDVDREEIEYFSNDADRLKERIRNLRTHEATGTQYGMKWATTLLHPDTRPLTNALIGAGAVSGDQAEFPRDFDEGQNLKFLVIMSDGNTTGQWRVKPEAYDTPVERDWWAVNTPGAQAVASSGDTAPVDIDVDDVFDTGFDPLGGNNWFASSGFNADDYVASVNTSGGDATDQAIRDALGGLTVDEYIDQAYNDAYNDAVNGGSDGSTQNSDPATGSNGSAGSTGGSDPATSTTTTTGTSTVNFDFNDVDLNALPVEDARAQFKANCEAAKAAGIIIYTIGFDIEDGSPAQEDMRACASLEEFFFDVDGLELIEAFDAIASNMQQLKLVL